MKMGYVLNKASQCLQSLRRVNLRGLRYGLRRIERHPRTRQFAKAVDYTIEIAGNKQYVGDNPAIKAAYSPLRWSLLVMLALALVTLVFGILVPIKSASVAPGTIVVAAHKKTVQHLEGGIIRKILVSDGDVVKRGQALIELNDTTPQASRNIAQKSLVMARINEARLNALRNGDETMEISNAIENAAASNPDIDQTLTAQKNAFITQRDAQNSKLGTLQQRVEQANEEIHGYEAQIASTENRLSLIEQEIAPMQKLVAKGYASRPQLLALQRHQEELFGNKGQMESSIAKIEQSITETQLQIDTIRSEYAQQISDEMTDLQSRITDSDEKLRASSDIMDRTVITAPHDGVVTSMKHHTIGAVISPGEALMDIVPQNERMVIEARVSPSDIDVVTQGLPCKISFSAYKTRSMPRVSGKVSYIAADVTSTVDQGQPTPPFYKAKIEVDPEELAHLTTAVKLSAGMPVEVFIETGSRSFIGYMFAPISGSFDRAFTED